MVAIRLQVLIKVINNRHEKERPRRESNPQPRPSGLRRLPGSPDYPFTLANFIRFRWRPSSLYTFLLRTGLARDYRR